MSSCKAVNATAHSITSALAREAWSDCRVGRASQYAELHHVVIYRTLFLCAKRNSFALIRLRDHLNCKSEQCVCKFSRARKANNKKESLERKGRWWQWIIIRGTSSWWLRLKVESRFGIDYLMSSIGARLDSSPEGIMQLPFHSIKFAYFVQPKSGSPSVRAHKIWSRFSLSLWVGRGGQWERKRNTTKMLKNCFFMAHQMPTTCNVA